MRTDYRLTAEDEQRVTAAMVATVEGWRGPRERGIDRDALVRIGASSIGCGLADLRECEVLWLEGRAARTLDAEVRS